LLRALVHPSNRSDEGLEGGFEVLIGNFNHTFVFDERPGCVVGDFVVDESIAPTPKAPERFRFLDLKGARGQVALNAMKARG
jgi:hypothetical protein